MAKKRRWGGRRTKRNASKKTSWKAFFKKHRKAGKTAKAIGRMWRGKRGVAANPRKTKRSKRRYGRRRTSRNPVAVAPNRPRKRRRGTRRYGRRTKRNAGVYRYAMAPVVANRPRKRRKGTRRYGRRTKRNAGVYRYAIAPVAANPFARNAVSGAMSFAKDTVLSPKFWTEWVAPLGFGFFGSRLGAYQLANLLVGKDADKKAKYWDKPYMKALWQGGLGVAGGIGIGLATRSRGGINFAVKEVAGSLVSALLTLLEGQDMYRKFTGMDGFSGLGADISSDLKRKISESIQKEIAAAEGVNDFVSQQSLLPTGGMNDFVNVQEVPEATGTMTLDNW